MFDFRKKELILLVRTSSAFNGIFRQMSWVLTFDDDKNPIIAEIITHHYRKISA